MWFLLMSTKKKIIFIVVSVIVLLLSVDLIVALSTKKPIFAIKDKNDNVNEIYYGLLTNSYDCAVYPKVQLKAKWKKYSCPSIEEGPRFKIIDPTRVCTQTLEEIYRSSAYTYYLTCETRNVITVEYEDGTIYALKEVIEKEIITIDKLIENGLKVYITPNN